VVVHVIDEFEICSCESEGHTPIAVDPYGPTTFWFALQGVEIPARSAHIAWLHSKLKGGQLIAQPDRMGGCIPAFEPVK
jgi:hypothetical protein